ncbi:transcription antitermination factor NusB [Dialister invisus]|jgi:transcription antitermination factor nusB|uniref:transcription antitermination factor NusB n=1 Tax=Dialister invisus TaxID=218538 RepID=UPI0039A0A462
MSRSKAREHALKVLYAKEINPNTAEISADISDALSEKGKSFSDFLVEQVQRHRDEIDGEIVRFLKKWSLSQLNIVDKNILRIAIAEFNYTYEDKADRKVIINEAVELAKVYGGENSYRFINGILSAVTGEKNG